MVLPVGLELACSASCSHSPPEAALFLPRVSTRLRNGARPAAGIRSQRRRAAKIQKTTAALFDLSSVNLTALAQNAASTFQNLSSRVEPNVPSNFRPVLDLAAADISSVLALQPTSGAMLRLGVRVVSPVSRDCRFCHSQYEGSGKLPRR